MLRHVEKHYRRRTVLKIDSLELVEGQRISLLGANGSGKSTLLRLLAGIATATRGHVIHAPQMRRLRISYLPQHGGVYPTLTVQQNLSLRAALFERPLDKDLARCPYVRDLGLIEFMNVAVGKLSGGYTRLCSIACALCVKPDILYLDEPFAGLDGNHRGTVIELLRSVESELKLLVTADHFEPSITSHPLQISLSNGMIR